MAKIKNYKNFKDEICLDFSNTAGYQFSTDCLYDGLISKMLILRWLISNIALKNDSILIKLSNYVRKMNVIGTGN
nr:hypothetical protein [uncultured Sellimonas sp.]